MPNLSETEKINKNTASLHTLTLDKQIDLMNKENLRSVLCLKKAKTSLKEAINLVAKTYLEKKTILFMGAGTSGRLGILEAAELPPTFSTLPKDFKALIAGGNKAVFKAVEGAEDHGDRAAEQERADDQHRTDRAALALEDLDEDAARDGGQRADGDILAAGGRGHERHAHGEDRELGGAVEDGDQVALEHRVAVVVGRDAHREEAGIPEEVENDQDRERDQRDQQLAEACGALPVLSHFSLHLPRSSSSHAPASARPPSARPRSCGRA